MQIAPVTTPDLADRARLQSPNDVAKHPGVQPQRVTSVDGGNVTIGDAEVQRPACPAVILQMGVGIHRIAGLVVADDVLGTASPSPRRGRVHEFAHDKVKQSASDRAIQAAALRRIQRPNRLGFRQGAQKLVCGEIGR
jgi:hypothetical protein